MHSDILSYDILSSYCVQFIIVLVVVIFCCYAYVHRLVTDLDFGTSCLPILDLSELKVVIITRARKRAG